MVKIYNVYGSLSDFEYEEIDKTIKEDLINIPTESSSISNNVYTCIKSIQTKKSKQNNTLSLKFHIFIQNK